MEENMSIYDLISLRKSVRTYKRDDIPQDILLRVLEAARLAPSASNRQEWRFVVVRDEEKRKQLAEAACNQIFVGEAPVVLACCADTDAHRMTCGQLCYPINIAIAMDHIVLCATAEGIGTCWIGAFYEDRVKAILNIPKHFRVVELLTMGFPRDPSPVRKRRLPLDQIVRYERWN